VPGSGY